MASILENSQVLLNVSLALQNGSDGKFCATEHASSVFKKALRDLGFDAIKPVVTEKPAKEIKEEVK